MRKIHFKELPHMIIGTSAEIPVRVRIVVGGDLEAGLFSPLLREPQFFPVSVSAD